MKHDDDNNKANFEREIKKNWNDLFATHSKWKVITRNENECLKFFFLFLQIFCFPSF